MSCKSAQFKSSGLTTAHRIFMKKFKTDEIRRTVTAIRSNTCYLLVFYPTTQAYVFLYVWYQALSLPHSVQLSQISTTDCLSNSLPLDPVPSQLNPFCIFISYLFKVHFNRILHLYLGLSRYSFKCLQWRFVYISHVPMAVTYLGHLTAHFTFLNNIVLWVELELLTKLVII
jgi:hypothetical protein